MGRDGHSGSERVAILLSTFNGAPFLPAQLESLLDQTHRNWHVLWRDDGSSDGTPALMDEFGRGSAAVHRVPGDGRAGVTESFLTLLRAADRGEYAAFADQDDVWLPDKLSRALRALAPFGARPALYCARQILVDQDLNHIGLSALDRGPTAFPAALTQNIATGCTAVLNPAAVRLVAQSRAPSRTLHDWWSYLVITANGGAVVRDDVPAVLYRQHRANTVGAPASRRRRALAALRRGPRVFMGVLRGHVSALQAQPELLTPPNRATLDVIAAGLGRGPAHRLRALATSGLVRQTRAETMLFRLWFLIG